MNDLTARFTFHFNKAGFDEVAAEAFRQVEGAHFLHFIRLE
jgi:hypothetical protein